MGEELACVALGMLPSRRALARHSRPLLCMLYLEIPENCCHPSELAMGVFVYEYEYLYMNTNIRIQIQIFI